MAARMSKAEWLRRRKRKKLIRRYTILGGLALIVLLILIIFIKLLSFAFSGNDGIIKKAGKVKIEKKLLTVDEHTRCTEKLEKVKGIIIHESGMPGMSANKLYDYYEEIGKNDTAYESVHFIVDTDGSIIQTIPCDEIAYHALTKNKDCLAIQYCYANEEGAMTGDTYKSMVSLCAKLCKKYKLKTDDIYLHHDATGVMCPKYYVENTESWQKFLSDVADEM